MDDDKLNFLDEKTEVAPETPDTTPEPAPAEVKGEIAAPPAAPDGNTAAIPISALLDERERRQKAEREAEEGRQYRRQMEEQQRRAAAQVPTDPEQRWQYEQQRFQGAILETKLQQSRFLAEREFGKDEVAAAYAYFDQHPQLSSQLLNHPSPFHAAVEFVRRQRIADEVGADPEAWRNKEREKLRAELMAEIQPEQPRQRLPGSLAAAPAAGRAGEPRARGSAFDAAFGG